MGKNVQPSLIRLNKAKLFGIVEPFHCSDQRNVLPWHFHALHRVQILRAGRHCRQSGDLDRPRKYSPTALQPYSPWRWMGVAGQQGAVSGACRRLIWPGKVKTCPASGPRQRCRLVSGIRLRCFSHLADGRFGAISDWQQRSATRLDRMIHGPGRPAFSTPQTPRAAAPWQRCCRGCRAQDRTDQAAPDVPGGAAE